MRTPAERDPSLALPSGHGSRLPDAVGWYRSQGRLLNGLPRPSATPPNGGLMNGAAALTATDWNSDRTGGGVPSGSRGVPPSAPSGGREYRTWRYRL